MGNYADVNTLLNIKEDDLEILEKNITPNCSNEQYYERIDDDYNNGKIVTISAMEFKNLTLLEYFVKLLFTSGIDKWVNYVQVKEEAMKQYNMTLNIATNTVDKINNKNEEKKIVTFDK